jgi:hypothetical protein
MSKPQLPALSFDRLTDAELAEYREFCRKAALWSEGEECQRWYNECFACDVEIAGRSARIDIVRAIQAMGA